MIPRHFTRNEAFHINKLYFYLFAWLKNVVPLRIQITAMVCKGLDSMICNMSPAKLTITAKKYDSWREKKKSTDSDKEWSTEEVVERFG